MNDETESLTTLHLTPLQVDTLRGFLGEYLDGDSAGEETLQTIYEQLTE